MAAAPEGSESNSKPPPLLSSPPLPFLAFSGNQDQPTGFFAFVFPHKMEFLRQSRSLPFPKSESQTRHAKTRAARGRHCAGRGGYIGGDPWKLRRFCHGSPSPSSRGSASE
uniref:Uncharacterized protein n=1 Tax=Oryza brachyantha TaxID=4533 RepID=J3LZ59_ORYBR